MKILIDLQCCQSGSRFGGIGRYSMSLAKAMLCLPSSHQFLLLLNSRLPNENVIRAEFASILPQQNILSFEVPSYVAAENDLPARTRMAEVIREKHIVEINPDILHIASLFEGAGEDVVTSVGSMFPAERTAVTLYDLIPYLQQEVYLTNSMLADHYLGKFAALRRAGMVVSISEFSRTEALGHTDIPPERIASISSAVDDQFAPREITAKAKSALLRKSGICRPFLMFAGSFDVRKNHDRLVKAFAKVPLALRRKYQLLIVGKGDDRQVSRLRETGRQHGLNEQDLVFVGHVSDPDLVALYNLCSLFVFPSLREGFGLPVLEAMSCGVPTIGSNRTSIPEVIGRDDALFDPEDVDDIASKITAVLDDSNLAADLKRHGLEQSKTFSWELSAKRALEFFEHTHRRVQRFPLASLAGGAPKFIDNSTIYDNFLAAFSHLGLGKEDDESRNSAARVVAANELRLRIDQNNFRCDIKAAWITPWQEGNHIASYSRELIDSLCQRPTIFASRSDHYLDVDEESFVACWDAGAGDSLLELQKMLASSNIDTVVIQYDFGAFALLALAKLIVQQKALGRYVFITLHSSAELSAVTMESGRLEIRGAFKICDGIFVHSADDLKNLELFKILRNVHFLPMQSLKGQNERANSGGVHLVANYFLGKIAFAVARGAGNGFDTAQARQKALD